MQRQVRITLAVLLVALFGITTWRCSQSPEPTYQGKRLSQWLDEYNRAGSMDKTEPISKAIRAMGTNSLPFLLAHIKRADSPLKQKLFALFAKQNLVKLPFYGANGYRSTSVLALRALGGEASPLCPELLTVAQNTNTSWWGLLSLLAIGTNSIPTLGVACRSPDSSVRTHAVLMIAMMKAMPPPWFSWGWNKGPISSKPMLSLGYAVSEEDVREITKLLAHSDPAVRHASAEALGHYCGGPYMAVSRSAVPLLVEALNDASPEVREAAGKTLKSIDSETAAKAGVK